MSLARRTRHRASRKQLIRDAFYCYVLAFAVLFLLLHFGKHHSFLSRNETLPVNAAAREAMLWAFITPAVWMLREYVLQGTELWASYSGLDWQMQRLVLGGAVALVIATLLAWRWMLPLWGFAVAVTLYLRFSRRKDSL